MTDSDRVQVILTKQAARAYRRGESARWPACVAARMITLNHRYERGVKQSFAKALGISISQVDNLSFAATTYRVLRNWLGQYGRPKLLHTVRRHLRFTHFAVLGSLWARYEFDPPIAIDYLYKAARYHLTVDQMRQMVEVDQAIQDGRPADGKQGVGNLDNLDSRRDLARQQRHHAQLAGARRAVVLAVIDNGSGYQVTLGTERGRDIPLEAEAWLVVINGGGGDG